MAGKTQLKKQERQLSPVDLTPSDGNNLEKVAPVKHWSIEDSENLYRIQGWGEPYFSINAAGNITSIAVSIRSSAINTVTSSSL